MNKCIVVTDILGGASVLGSLHKNRTKIGCVYVVTVLLFLFLKNPITLL